MLLIEETAQYNSCLLQIFVVVAVCILLIIQSCMTASSMSIGRQHSNKLFLQLKNLKQFFGICFCGVMLALGSSIKF